MEQSKIDWEGIMKAYDLRGTMMKRVMMEAVLAALPLILEHVAKNGKVRHYGYNMAEAMIDKASITGQKDDIRKMLGI